MRIAKHEQPNKRISGYYMNLSANDTYKWAHKSSGGWSCSTVANRRLAVGVDDNGLCNFVVDGKHGHDVDGVELEAIVDDFLPADCRHLWPVWGAIE